MNLQDQAYLELVSAGLAARRRGEVAELELVAGWVARHGEARDDRDPLITPGGDGTPSVREYALPELAMAREEHALRTRSMVSDVLDPLHRLPKTWSVVTSLEWSRGSPAGSHP